MNAIEAAKQITDDIDARYKAFADAETLLITNALVIPRGMSVPAYLATRLNYWEGQYASTGFSNKRLKASTSSTTTSPWTSTRQTVTLAKRSFFS